MERHWNSNVSININCPIGKSIFAVNLTLKLLRATVANTDIGSLKFLHTLLDTYLDYVLMQFKQRTNQAIPLESELTEKSTSQ